MSHSSNKKGVSRRFFMGSISALGLGSVFAGRRAGAAEKKEAKEIQLDDSVDSFPMLQNPTPQSMNVVWAMKCPGTGYVEWGLSESLGNTARTSCRGLYAYDERIMTAPIQGLAPNTRYFYRTVTIGMNFPRYARIEAGKPVYSKVYSFVTPGPKSPQTSFAMINDTHERQSSLKILAEKLLQLKADYTIWNGDLLNDTNTQEQAVAGILKAGSAPFAAEKPVLFSMGNHDHRGPWARELKQIVLPWQHNDPRWRDLGNNFAVRHGSVAFIGMDTGEDKPDQHPLWAGMANFTSYRRLQTQWLEATLNQPEIKSARFVVVSCHIPLFDSDPTANPGDVLERYASWQRPCSQQWSPLFQKYGVQVVLVAHKHKFSYEPPQGRRNWHQFRGGGPDEKKNLAMIHGKAGNAKMIIEADNLVDNTSFGRWEIKPRG